VFRASLSLAAATSLSNSPYVKLRPESECTIAVDFGLWLATASKIGILGKVEAIRTEWSILRLKEAGRDRLVNARAAPCAHIVDRRRSSCSGSGGVKVRSYDLVLCGIVMLLFRPYSYGHRANPELPDLSSRSLRNADGRCNRRIGQLDGGVKPEKVGREYAW